MRSRPSLAPAARRSLTGTGAGGLSQEATLTWPCEQAVRNFDPCISCATHAVKARIERDWRRVARVVIGVGNDLRGDDAAGWETVRRLSASGSLVLHEHAGDAPGLISLWGPNDHVVIVDAVVSDDPPGTILEIDALAGRLPAAVSWATTHGAGIAEGVELARALGLLPRSLVVVGIVARRFDLGAPMTSEVEQAVDEVVRRLRG